jgi:hypothetical protein
MSGILITSCCRIQPGTVFLNDKPWYEAGEKASGDRLGFFSAVYERLGIDYRKFFKMDALSKLGFLASELVLAGMDRETPKEDLGIAMINRSASLEADRKYQQTIRHPDNFFPSPSDFVYTLPNIVLGEIAIRHKIYGETAFYLMPALRWERLAEIVDAMIHQAGMKQVLAGWVEVDAFSEAFECRMMLAEASAAPGSGERMHPCLRRTFTNT